MGRLWDVVWKADTEVPPYKKTCYDGPIQVPQPHYVIVQVERKNVAGVVLGHDLVPVETRSVKVNLATKRTVRSRVGQWALGFSFTFHKVQNWEPGRGLFRAPD